MKAPAEFGKSNFYLVEGVKLQYNNFLSQKDFFFGGRCLNKNWNPFQLLPITYQAHSGAECMWNAILL